MKLKQKINEELNSHEGFVIMKALWKNKRYRSIFWLILYFIFFALVMTSVSSRYRNQPEILESSRLDIVESLKLKDYSYEILLNEESLIKGKVENYTNTFVYRNQSYVVVGDNVYLEKGLDLIKADLTKNKELIIPINKIMLDRLRQYIEGITPEKLEEALKYNISVSNLIDSETVYFTISFYGNSKLERIVLNFNEFAELKGLEYEQYILTIKLGDIKKDKSDKSGN